MLLFFRLFKQFVTFSHCQFLYLVNFTKIYPRGASHMKVFKKFSWEDSGTTEVWTDVCEELLPWERPPMWHWWHTEFLANWSRWHVYGLGGLALSWTQMWPLLGQGQGRAWDSSSIGHKAHNLDITLRASLSSEREARSPQVSLSLQRTVSLHKYLLNAHCTLRGASRDLRVGKWPCKHTVAAWWVL